MKSLQTTTTGSLFNHTGILTHCGDYAGKFQDEAAKILEIVSAKKNEIFDNVEGWADIMIDEKEMKVYSVWANESLTAQSGLLEYIELDEEDCPEAFLEAKSKFENY